ncbi:hypothetical protein [Parafilimonas terrae]|jgi:hypothetical protein|uniref:Uncharacterized protein n=1 Tax=Parafilimonas terrae TaxID=1465490 RepID=A0A1I5VMV6_9BACT|nr:hypothetical protein [Parafilimonas terrae]SFQ08835.1 hypothetical protein SAMN05444277_10589 [Parafilimonas terrae]
MPFTLKQLEPYNKIKRYVINYYDFMKKVSKALSTIPGPPEIDLNEPIGFYISKSEFDDFKTIADLKGFDSYLGLFGIDDNGNLTVCFVGADKSKKILDDYKDDPATYGVEKWSVKSSLTLASSPGDISDFLNKK